MQSEREVTAQFLTWAGAGGPAHLHWIIPTVGGSCSSLRSKGVFVKFGTHSMGTGVWIWPNRWILISSQLPRPPCLWDCSRHHHTPPAQKNRCAQGAWPVQGSFLPPVLYAAAGHKQLASANGWCPSWLLTLSDYASAGRFLLLKAKVPPLDEFGLW